MAFEHTFTEAATRIWVAVVAKDHTEPVGRSGWIDLADTARRSVSGGRVSCPEPPRVGAEESISIRTAPRHHFGMMTVSITWTTPFDASMSVPTILAPFTMRRPSAIENFTVPPCRVFASPATTAPRASTAPGTT